MKQSGVVAATPTDALWAAMMMPCDGPLPPGTAIKRCDRETRALLARLTSDEARAMFGAKEMLTPPVRSKQRDNKR